MSVKDGKNLVVHRKLKTTVNQLQNPSKNPYNSVPSSKKAEE